MKISATLAFVVAVTLASPGFAQAPQAPKAKAGPRAAQATPSPTPAPQADAAPANTPAPPGWVARCSSPSRDAPLECAVEQTAVLTKTGQVIVLLNIRVAGETRQPIAIIQLPLGLNLPAGAKLQVDDGKVSDLQIQTCEQRGCYANSAIPADMLAAMKSGKQLKVSFQNMAKESITIPMPLADFAAAYDKIK
ncbi:invasion associated locus B family protein [Bradyrhizobium sp. AUGA SZCCT0431]|uniref:invasion associated locus B family protein n=1 Tax=Bradyrhizobium sp. AUGA SZCCT0431 TaxID=2807674 RepID=UPI001BA44705|nr:invasion associated locus B family protein [Bradyrhizobium sp. AUGA SZCCT0431]MBR1142786.1 invasion associated locus B family protein [Bradyrhizobium sp. AUGA SZCCT0431]